MRIFHYWAAMSRPTRIGLLLTLLTLALFAGLGVWIGIGGLPLDSDLMWQIRAWSSPTMDSAMRGITHTGAFVVVLPVVIGSAAVLVLRRPGAATATAVIVLSTVGAALLSWSSKLLFVRSRPDLWPALTLETSHSFPSGHAMASMTFALAIGFCCWRTRWRWWVIGAAATWVAVIALSRIYLGVHYPSDVLGGWLLSAAWTTLVITAVVCDGATHRE